MVKKTTRKKDGHPLIEAKREWKGAIAKVNPAFGQEMLKDPTYEAGSYMRWCAARKMRAAEFRARCGKAIDYLAAYLVGYEAYRQRTITGLETLPQALCFAGRMHEEIGGLRNARTHYAAAEVFVSADASHWLSVQRLN